MPPPPTDRSQLKRKTVVRAANSLFLERGYDGTTMDDVAARAGVSKPTLYRYFADKDGLYAAVVQATADDVDTLVRLVTDELAGDAHPREGLCRLAEKLLNVLMQPDLLRLRRLVIAQAERFPEVGRNWFRLGFGRVLETLATAFQRYDDNGFLILPDPLLAANHFAGLLLWTPFNRAMFGGETRYNPRELEHYAQAAVEAFLKGYGSRHEDR
jgi:TetR/AcrR family transcriptional repressor of mexJK operon